MKRVIFLALCIFSNLAYAKCSNEYINKAYLTALDVKNSSEHQFVREMPISITIAQNILETGCGKSYSARNRNNYYGLMDKNGKHLQFDDLEHSTSYYFENLAKHRAYYKFRSSVLQNKSLKTMVELLSKVYAQDPKYSKKIIGIINKYELQTLD